MLVLGAGHAGAAVESLLAPMALEKATLRAPPQAATSTWDSAAQTRRITVTSVQERPWDVELRMPVSGHVGPGGWLEVALEVDPGPHGGYVSVGLQIDRAPWTKLLEGRFWLAPGPQRVGQTVDAPAQSPGTGLALVMHWGTRTQSAALRTVTLTWHAPTDPRPPGLRTSYPGRELDATWRAPAEERIRAHRMSDVHLRVRNADGRPVPDAEIRWEQVQHHFPFGVAVDEVALLEGDPRYREVFRAQFNAAVLENGLKAKRWEDPLARQRTMAALEQLHTWGIPVRGHTVIWGAERFLGPSHQQRMGYRPEQHGVGRSSQRLRQDLGPDGVADLEAALGVDVIERISAVRGRVAEWDVVNEPISEPVVMNLVGRQGLSRWLSLARATDPQVRLMINEQGMFFDPERSTAMEKLVRDVQAAGAPLDGLGEQGHVDGVPPGIPAWENFVDRFGPLGLRLLITEFDVATDDEHLAADWLRDSFLYLFSRPEIHGIYQWGFWAGQHWKPSAALWRRDWTERPAARAYRELVYGRWWSRLQGTTDGEGQWRSRVFQGQHRVTVAGKELRVPVGLDSVQLEVILP